jgi:hypothetical protein
MSFSNESMEALRLKVGLAAEQGREGQRQPDAAQFIGRRRRGRCPSAPEERITGRTSEVERR